ncbi:hypothetical protein GGR50DRAFT_664018 [Xylaria sp. CBS 124048]|nr:hypothetical protein GGR50DRAFT_664018 [Xylaria sp. CBS 124048]
MASAPRAYTQTTPSTSKISPQHTGTFSSRSEKLPVHKNVVVPCVITSKSPALEDMTDEMRERVWAAADVIAPSDGVSREWLSVRRVDFLPT